MKQKLTKKQSLEVMELLSKAYPMARCELNFDTPLQLLIATMLSAQTTDKQVNKVTTILFQDAPDLPSLLELSLEKLTSYVRTLNFYHNKAAHIYEMLRIVEAKHGGNVPRTMEELTKLPGVGRKTANVVLSNAFGIPALAVDTHVFRVSNRLGLVKEKTPEDTEIALKKTLPENLWSSAHHVLIFHGRYGCTARKPGCETCPVRSFCLHPVIS